MEQKRVGVVGIVVKDNQAAAGEIQKILTEFSSLVIGRMGIPDRAHSICIISVAVEGDTPSISALTGRLGRLEGVTVKSALTTVEVI